ncbi:uncharacterized protein LOC121732265 isoform X2 [Aricia agestis]|uniref:uncharacterized protein LOC121732265 isoform X2 n=1 Tax=Aricia agestis TaxID=91739 RepID=UPI001C20BBF3|nr:uncharacterized protein LOC121732265 isoform X2 [Aricia agestis]
MLQSLLQPRENQRPKMIGAMPAVAVRHERRRAEKRSGRRPSQLALSLGRGDDATPSPDRYRSELYFCGRIAVLHAIVGSLLLGIVVLVVGLVQLSPGAEAAQHRYYLMGAGAALVGVGVLAAVLRCVCLHWHSRKYREEYEEPAVRATQKNGVSVVEQKAGTAHDKHDKHDKHNKHDKLDKLDKPKLKSQSSLAQEVDLIKQPSVASDT